METAMKAKRRKSRKPGTKCIVVRRRMGSAGLRNILKCPGKPAKMISEARAKQYRRGRR